MLEVTTRKYLPLYDRTITFVKAMTTSADTVLATTIMLNGSYQHLPKGQHIYFSEALSGLNREEKCYRMKVYQLRGTPEEITEVSVTMRVAVTLNLGMPTRTCKRIKQEEGQEQQILTVQPPRESH